MRCPKCGYISFDHAETCSKCKKDISAISEQLSGTMLMAESPAFLQFNLSEAQGTVDRGIDVTPDEVVFDSDTVVDLEEADTSGEIEFDLVEENTGETGSAEVDDAEDFDLPLTDEESIDLIMGDTEEADIKIDEKPQVDFSGLDISDLGPPDADVALTDAALTLEGDGSSDISDSSPLGKAGSGLEDISTDGLDLATPSLPPVGSVTGEKFRPAVKTGTALDNFDFDLGELITSKEE